jgi:predicted transcriptional regulator
MYVRGLRELETAVMEQVWAHDRPVTVVTVMNRLVKKGMLAKQRPGRAATFRALRSREAYTAALMTAVLGTASDPPAVLLRFADQLPADHAEALRRALEAGRQDPERDQ